MDVLIIGGGVQGLWLLNDLKHLGYSAVLLERRELGGEQTCHSHVYIHHGHLYQEDQGGLRANLQQVRKLWDGWLESHTVQHAYTPSCFGFSNPADAKQKADFWDLLGLNYTRMPVPAVLDGGAITVAYKTDERCLIGNSLVDALRKPDGVENSIRCVDEIESIAVTVPRAPDQRSRASIVDVHARIGDEPVTFSPRALVFAAGTHNQALIDLACGGRRGLANHAGDAQQLRLAHMLVVRGHALPPLTGIFPKLGGLFIASRELETGEVVWLISDNQSPPLIHAEDWLIYDARWWLRRVLILLQQLAPAIFTGYALHAWKWGVYVGPKAEGRAGGTLPDQPRVEQFGFKNMWAVWPTKLTLAPVAAAIAVEQIVRRLQSPAPVDQKTIDSWTQLPRRPLTAFERWTMTPMSSWNDFKRQHGIAYLDEDGRR